MTAVIRFSTKSGLRNYIIICKSNDYFHLGTRLHATIHSFCATYWFHIVWNHSNGNSNLWPICFVIYLHNESIVTQTCFAMEGKPWSPRSHLTKPPYKLLHALPLAIRVISFKGFSSSTEWSWKSSDIAFVKQAIPEALDAIPAAVGNELYVSIRIWHSAKCSFEHSVSNWWLFWIVASIHTKTFWFWNDNE